MTHNNLPTPFSCTVERSGSRVVVSPAGELDLGTAETVDARLREAREGGADKIVLDLREVTFLGSTGLRLVLTWNNSSRADGFEFALVRGPRPVERIFELTRVSDSLQFVDA